MQNKPVKFPLILLFHIVAACLPLLGPNPAAADATAGVKIMSKETVGEYLVAGNGMTLYTYSRDEENTSHCAEGCAVNWPPFHAGPDAVFKGLNEAEFGTITRDDGRKQTSFRGRPLYHFKNDKYPGDTFGDGIGGVWFPARP